jgi:hypothetical protein
VREGASVWARLKANSCQEKVCVCVCVRAVSLNVPEAEGTRRSLPQCDSVGETWDVIMLRTEEAV